MIYHVTLINNNEISLWWSDFDKTLIRFWPDFDKKFITWIYHEGDVIKAKVNLTLNHKGYLRFRICPATTDQVKVTKKCLDQHLLEVAGSSDKKYKQINDNNRAFEIWLRLPKLTCNRSIFQWTWTAGNY